jgi:hypothetical protein
MSQSEIMTIKVKCLEIAKEVSPDVDRIEETYKRLIALIGLL